MVKKLLLALAGLFTALSLSAQNHKITLQLQDATTGEAVGFATVSATPAKGQAKYTLSGSDGKATIEKVRAGVYTLKAELLGYKPYEKVLELKADANLGVIKMEQDQEVLDAASVSAVGNPIIIKKDTVEYNASSFKISDDNMLVDLLKKLPGIEVAEDGSHHRRQDLLPGRPSAGLQQPPRQAGGEGEGNQEEERAGRIHRH